jgi:hypothetical protein
VGGRDGRATHLRRPATRRGARPGPKALVRGLALLASEPRLRLITSLGLAQTLTRGALNVLLVVVAIDLLEAGDEGVGWLNAAIGAGGVLGGLSAFGAVRGGRLGAGLGLGVALFGAPLMFLGLVPELAAAVVLLGVIGLGNALIDACGFTLLARLTDEAVLARMFAGFEALLTLGVAVGGLLAPLAVDALGLRDALVTVGLLAPLAVAAGWRALRRLDALMAVRDADIDVLREIPLLRALPVATIEQLGSRLVREEFAPGEIVFEQGEVGEHFYAVESGNAEVLHDGRHVGLLGRGEYFGEIALLRDGPRTATVRAAPGSPLRVGALPRFAFLTAVTGYPASAAAGERLASQRIDALGYDDGPPAIVTSAEADTR